MFCLQCVCGSSEPTEIVCAGFDVSKSDTNAEFRVSVLGGFEEEDDLSHEVIVVIPCQVCLWFGCDALLVELDVRSAARGGKYEEDVDVREIGFGRAGRG